MEKNTKKYLTKDHQKVWTQVQSLLVNMGISYPVHTTETTILAVILFILIELIVMHKLVLHHKSK